MNYDRTTNTQVKSNSRSNKTNKRCCRDSFVQELMNIKMFGELQNYWDGRNIKVLRGSIISRLPETFVKKYSKHLDHFVKYMEKELNINR